MRLFLSGALAIAPTFVSAQPASTPAPDLKPGDTWVFDRTIEKGVSGFADRHVVLKIKRVGADTMVVGLKIEGSPVDFQDHIAGLDWSQRRIVDGVQTATTRPLSFPLTIGKTWTGVFVDPTHYGLQISAEHQSTYKVTGWKDVTTTAGAFHALVIEEDDKIKGQFAAATGAVGGAVTTADGSTIVAHSDHSGPHTVYGERFSTLYYVPEIKYWVKSVQEDYSSENVRTMRQTDTLISFKPGS